MILLECPETGERCLVESAEGYPGWLVLSEDAPPQPDDHCDWCCDKKGWKENRAAKARAAKLAALRDPEALLDLIDNLTARIAALESKEK